MMHLFQVTFTEEELPKACGDFILGFYSNNMNTIVGVTEPFQVMISDPMFYLFCVLDVVVM